MIVHSFYVIIAFPQAARHVQLMPQSESLFTEHKNHQGQELSGSVRLTLPTLFENQEILQRLLKHLRDYPHLNIEWLPTGTHLNIIDEQIDIGIRIGTVPDNRFIVKCICPVGVNIVASPDLMARTGVPESLRDLQFNYPLSALNNSNSGRVWPWQFSAPISLCYPRAYGWSLTG